eukprot:3594585-Prymnesium_polylepis.1
MRWLPSSPVAAGHRWACHRLTYCAQTERAHPAGCCTASSVRRLPPRPLHPQSQRVCHTPRPRSVPVQRAGQLPGCSTRR